MSSGTLNLAQPTNLLTFSVTGQGHFSISGPKFTNFFHRMWKKLQFITPFSTCRFLDPFQGYSRSKSTVVLNLVHWEPLHLAWWNFVRTCTSTTSGTLLNFKVKGQGHVGLWMFSCVPDAAATRGQYLALMILFHFKLVCFVSTVVWTYVDQFFIVI